MMRKALVALGYLCALGGGCQSQQQEPYRASLEHADPAAAEFHAELERRGRLVFRSWSGKALRRDDDAELVFRRDRTLVLLEYGYVGSAYNGTFEVDAKGTLAIRLWGYPATWPRMIVGRDDQSLFIKPEPGAYFVRGGRPAYPAERRGGFWPLRRLIGTDEAEVLETSERWAPVSSGWTPLQGQAAREQTIGVGVVAEARRVLLPIVVVLLLLTAIRSREHERGDDA